VLRRRWERGGEARHPASVDDYANLCRAALALFDQRALQLESLRVIDAPQIAPATAMHWALPM